MNKIEFWRLQKDAKLTNQKCAEYLGVKTRTIGRWRVSNPEAPKVAIIALEAFISKM